MNQSTFGLLIFLFSASQVKCTEQKVNSVQKPASEKQVVRTNWRWLGEFCFGASIGALVAALIGWIIVSNRNSVNSKLRQEVYENRNLTFQYMVITSGKLENEEDFLLFNKDTGEIFRSDDIPLKVGDIIIVTQPKSGKELKLKVDKIITGTLLGKTYEFEYQNTNGLWAKVNFN